MIELRLRRVQTKDALISPDDIGLIFEGDGFERRIMMSTEAAEQAIDALRQALHAAAKEAERQGRPTNRVQYQGPLEELTGFELALSHDGQTAYLRRLLADGTTRLSALPRSRLRDLASTIRRLLGNLPAR